MENYFFGVSTEYSCISKLISRGYEVLEPSNPYSPYDIVIIKDGEILKLQVKATRTMNKKSYRVAVSQGRDKTNYKKGDVDFFCIYLEPTNTWYVIPRDFVGTRKNLYLTKTVDKFKDNWGFDEQNEG